MKPTKLYIHIKNKFDEANRYKRQNPELTLREFLKTYPAQFPKGHVPGADQLKLPLSHFIFQPVKSSKKQQKIQTKTEVHEDDCRMDFDNDWENEQDTSCSESNKNGEPDQYPDIITDNEAVRIAYRLEMDSIADYLKNDLSVLVSCDKVLTEYIYEVVCAQAGKKLVLDLDDVPDQPTTKGSQLDNALQGGPPNPLENLPKLLNNLKTNEMMVLRSLDMLDKPEIIEQLYRRTGSGEKPQLLGFIDPSLEVKKVLTDRFAVHISLMGLPRHTTMNKNQEVYTVTQLITQNERNCFDHYEPEGLYKNVAGLNAIQFRNAMKYVGAMVAPGTQSTDLYRVIRQFKTSSSDEIDIPDTTFDNIGGYEDVKQQLRRIIALIAGSVTNLSQKQSKDLTPRGFIFHGPPGTGKTLFAKAIANEMNATIQMISGPEIMDKYVGQSENNLRRIFATARRNAPAVIFFDEFDSIASQRSNYSDGGARSNNAVVAQLLTELDGFRQDQTVLLVGTSNRIDIIDEALLRPSRLKPIEIGNPDYEARKCVAQIHATNFGVDQLVLNICDMAIHYLEKNIVVQNNTLNPSLLEAFQKELFDRYPPYKARYDNELKRAGLIRDIIGFLKFVDNCTDAPEVNSESPPALLNELRQKAISLGKSVGVDLSQLNLDDINPETQSWPIEIISHMKDILFILDNEKKQNKRVSGKHFFDALIELVAENTINYNNDEIRAIFQESSLEYHMEGQLITPRFIGAKIGMIQKRRDEKAAIHLSGDRGV